jgi:alkanesulfonate monooxygenase SsuD/methylene tetrahydromethanopterin reductase-like flavin-dependent oxidoreductase (luciferase family)
MPNPLLFGANVDPTSDQIKDSVARAQLADRAGLDLITVQDHPYNRRFLDTWTFLTVLAMKTERVHIGTNVANLPLRPPAMLAKAAASLDVLSGGRVELGLGAGAYWQGIQAYGAAPRTPAEAYAAFEDALHILRGMWSGTSRGFTYEGKVYQVKGAHPGPTPAHPIRIWVGAARPKMLRLTGRMADGILVSSTYEPPERLLEINQWIDQGAQEVGRVPDDIRRGYNLMGIVDFGQYGGKPANLERGVLYGAPEDWITMLVGLYNDYRQDTFLFWPVGEEPLRQLDRFAHEIVPVVRETL